MKGVLGAIRYGVATNLAGYLAGAVGLIAAAALFVVWASVDSGLTTYAGSQGKKPGSELASVEAAPGRGQLAAVADIDAARRVLSRRGTQVTLVVEGPVSASAGSVAAPASLVGVDSQFEKLAGVSLKRGDFIGEAQIQAGRRVGVVTEETARLFFGAREAVGKRLAVEGQKLTIIGVTENPIGPSAIKRRQILVPADIARVLTGAEAKPRLLVGAGAGNGAGGRLNTAQIQLAIDEKLGRGRLLALDQTAAQRARADESSRLALATRSAAVTALVLGAFSTAAAFVWIGRRRTVEFVARRLAGAGSSHIFIQLVGESILVSVLVTALGIAIGAGALLYLAPSHPVRFSLPAAGVVVAALLGLGFVLGLIPAARAIRLRPADFLD